MPEEKSTEVSQQALPDSIFTILLVPYIPLQNYIFIISYIR